MSGERMSGERMSGERMSGERMIIHPLRCARPPVSGGQSAGAVRGERVSVFVLIRLRRLDFAHARQFKQV